MIKDLLDYEKTIKLNRLIYKGQKYRKFINCFILSILSIIGLIAGYFLSEMQLKGDPIFMDYLIVLIFVSVIIILICFSWINILNKDKLKEIDNYPSNNAKIRLLEAANKLNWRADIIRDNYIIFFTELEYSNKCQIITIIFFPDNRIYFNSQCYFIIYISPSRFKINYQALMNEYLKY